MAQPAGAGRPRAPVDACANAARTRARHPGPRAPSLDRARHAPAHQRPAAREQYRRDASGRAEEASPGCAEPSPGLSARFCAPPRAAVSGEACGGVRWVRVRGCARAWGGGEGGRGPNGASKLEVRPRRAFSHLLHVPPQLRLPEHPQHAPRVICGGERFAVGAGANGSTQRCEDSRRCASGDATRRWTSWRWGLWQRRLRRPAGRRKTRRGGGERRGLV